MVKLTDLDNDHLEHEFSKRLVWSELAFIQTNLVKLSVVGNMPVALASLDSLFRNRSSYVRKTEAKC